MGAACSFAWGAVLEPAAVRSGCVTVAVDTEEDMVANVGGCVVERQLVDQQLQAVVWCSGRRDDGSTWDVLNRHKWSKPPKPFILGPCFLGGSANRCCGQARQDQRPRLFDFQITGSAKKDGSECVSLVVRGQD